MVKTENKSITADIDLWRRIQEVARLQGRSMSGIIRILLNGVDAGIIDLDSITKQLEN